MGSPFGMVLTGEGPPPDAPSASLELSGVVTEAVDAVVVELADGRLARAVLFSLAPAGVEGRGFVVYVPADAPDPTVLALDGDGSEIDRFEILDPSQ